MKQPRVLLVDDEGELVFTLAERLTMRGMAVDALTSGEEALALAGDGTHDVAVVDVKMPGMGGIEVLRGLRERDRNLPVILLTGHGSVDEVEADMQNGAFACLFKPVDIRELIQSMTAATAGAGHE